MSHGTASPLHPDRELIAPLAPFFEGETLVPPDVAPHISLMPRYWVPSTRRSEYIDRMTELFHDAAPIHVQIGKEDRYGERKTIRVQRLGSISALLTLHLQVLQVIDHVEGRVDCSHIGDAYQPHVLLKHKQQMDEGSVHRVDEIFELHQSDQLTVAHAYPLMRGNVL